MDVVDIASRLGIPVAILVAIGYGTVVGVRAVWNYLTPFTTRFMNAGIDLAVALGLHLPRQTVAIEESLQLKKDMSKTMEVQIVLLKRLEEKLDKVKA